MKRFLRISSVVAFALGAVLVIAGIAGAGFTYRSIVQERIVTPADASLPERPVRGPLTLKAQADVIRHHVLGTTGGRTYAEMPRQVPQLDASGAPVRDKEGKQAMVPNEAREIWVTATTLVTALNLGIVAYALSGLVVLLGLMTAWTGVFLRLLARRAPFAPKG